MALVMMGERFRLRILSPLNFRNHFLFSNFRLHKRKPIEISCGHFVKCDIYFHSLVPDTCICLGAIRPKVDNLILRIHSVFPPFKIVGTKNFKKGGT